MNSFYCIGRFTRFLSEICCYLQVFVFVPVLDYFNVIKLVPNSQIRSQTVFLTVYYICLKMQRSYENLICHPRRTAWMSTQLFCVTMIAQIIVIEQHLLLTPHIISITHKRHKLLLDTNIRKQWLAFRVKQCKL